MARTILVVDDEQDIVFLIKRRLIKNGYHVLAANDGVNAFALAKKEQPDLIILDIMMPEPNGLEVCRRLKQDPLCRGIRIILLTAKDQPKDKDLGLHVGADLYVTKPFEPDELIKNVQTLLGE
jgi:DNA-binding response OmpR family regulator